MASSFSIFRKHQKGLMAAMLIVAMVSFVVLGSLDNLLDLRGRRGGGGHSENVVVATWKGGKFMSQDMARMRQNRVMLNAFQSELKQKEVQNNGRDQVADFRPFSTEYAAIVQSVLWADAARRMGIVITDQQIEDYIKQFNLDRVTASQINDAMQRVRINDRGITKPQIVEAYRHELLAGAGRRLVGAYGLYDYDYDATPAQRWDYYSRLNRRVRAQVYAIPVDPFITDPSIPEPSEAELAAFYEKHKDTESTPESPDIGFRLPDRVKLEYLRADYLKFYDSARAAITEKEILADFETRKATLRLATESAEGMFDFPTDEDAEKEKDAEKKDAEKKDGEKKDADGKAAETKAAEAKAVVKAPEPEPTPYELATGRFDKHPPKATEPRFSDDEILSRNRDAIVKSLAESRAHLAMTKAIDDAYRRMEAFYEREWRRWLSANQDKPEMDRTSPPTFSLASLAKADVGLTYHQTDWLSRPALSRDRHLGESFVNRRWTTDTQSGQPQLAESGTLLYKYVFQTKLKMVPFRAEDDSSSATAATRGNQYVAWKVGFQERHLPAFSEIREEVRRAWKLANTTGKSARDLARKKAEEIATDVNGTRRTLKEYLANRPSAVVKEISDFSWFRSEVVPLHDRIPIPVNLEPTRTKLDEVEGGEDRFMQSVFRLKDKEAGVAMNDPGNIVYVVQVFDGFNSSTKELEEGFVKAKFRDYRPGLSTFRPEVSDEQGYVAVSIDDMRRRRYAAQRQLEREYDLKWEADYERGEE